MLADNSVTIPDGYGITFTTGPIRPQEDSGDLQYGTGFDVGQLEYSNGQLAVLEKGTPSYNSCSSDTVYIASTTLYTNYSPGTMLCFTGHGVVAAVTVTAVDAASGGAPSDVKADVIVWKS